MKSKDPAFLFYSKDWVDGTAEMIPSEKGIYIDLLAHQHQHKSIPSDITRLSRIVRMPVKEFEPLWKEVSKKFIPNGEPNGERLVNERLQKEMGERSAKGTINRITGTFAAVLKNAELSNENYRFIKSEFDVKEFISIPTERLTERLTEWLHIRLKSIEDANGNANGNIIGIKEREEKFKNTIQPFVEKYGNEICNAFFYYWTEPNKSGTKMRFEQQATWEISRRLRTWANNNKSFTKNGTGKGKDMERLERILSINAEAKKSIENEYPND